MKLRTCDFTWCIWILSLFLVAPVRTKESRVRIGVGYWFMRICCAMRIIAKGGRCDSIILLDMH
jgi:hypothetical protein